MVLFAINCRVAEFVGCGLGSAVEFGYQHTLANGVAMCPVQPLSIVLGFPASFWSIAAAWSVNAAFHAARISGLGWCCYCMATVVCPTWRPGRRSNFIPTRFVCGDAGGRWESSR